MDHHQRQQKTPISRYEEVSRRSFLRRATQTAGLVVIFPILSACGDDREVFQGGASTTLAPPTTVTTTTLPPTTSTTAPTTTKAEVIDAGESLPSGSEMVVAFSYTPSATGGRVRNPYVAVWVEDEGGELVDTIALWYLQTQKGTRWLTDLRRWYSVDGSQSTVDAVSSATRTPGDYRVVWNTSDTAGQQIVAGDYFVCIEAAREHGPYSLIREPISISAESMTIALGSDGELDNAGVDLRVA